MSRALPVLLLATVAALPASARTEPIRVPLPGGATMEMVWIPPGRFLMGSPDSERSRTSDEGPQHEVTISRGFHLGRTEVTQAQWESVMDSRPWEGMIYVREAPDHPAAHVSWIDAQRLLARLNDAEGAERYRLPTEAEWEYACRAGTQTPWSFGDDEALIGEHAWYRANASDVGERYSHAVATKRANPWGLHDMHGNVAEWVQDWYDEGYYSRSPEVDPPGPQASMLQGGQPGGYRAFRGGTFLNLPRDLRSARRNFVVLIYRTNYVGVRLVRQEPPVPSPVRTESWGQLKAR